MRFCARAVFLILLSFLVLPPRMSSLLSLVVGRLSRGSYSYSFVTASGAQGEEGGKMNLGEPLRCDLSVPGTITFR